MFPCLSRFYSATLVAFQYFGYLGYRAFGLLSGIFPPFIRYQPSESGTDKPDDPEANDASHVGAISSCDTYTLRLHPQRDLEVIGIGASAQVYEVNDDIVLKTSWVFEPPESSASDNDRWHYASDTLFHSNLLQKRAVLRVLQRWPHPHIIEAIDTDQCEGVYLRRYRSVSNDQIPPQLDRIRWYRDLTDALCHIHSLGIAHADVRIDNVLFDEKGVVILSDFSAASPLGQPTPVSLNLPLPVNGPSSTLSEATDMFAMGSLVFQMEHGAKPLLSVDSHGILVLPQISTDHQCLDTIIRKAWLGHYSRTSEMLEALNSIDTHGALPTCDTELSSGSTELLKDQIRTWREFRENKLGCIIDGLHSESQLQDLADCYGLDKDADLHFIGHQVHL